MRGPAKHQNVNRERVWSGYLQICSNTSNLAYPESILQVSLVSGTGHSSIESVDVHLRVNAGLDNSKISKIAQRLITIVSLTWSEEVQAQCPLVCAKDSRLGCGKSEIRIRGETESRPR